MSLYKRCNCYVMSDYYISLKSGWIDFSKLGSTTSSGVPLYYSCLEIQNFEPPGMLQKSKGHRHSSPSQKMASFDTVFTVFSLRLRKSMWRLAERAIMSQILRESLPLIEWHSRGVWSILHNSNAPLRFQMLEGYTDEVTLLKVISHGQLVLCWSSSLKVIENKKWSEHSYNITLNDHNYTLSLHQLNSNLYICVSNLTNNGQQIRLCLSDRQIHARCSCAMVPSSCLYTSWNNLPALHQVS